MPKKLPWPRSVKALMSDPRVNEVSIGELYDQGVEVGGYDYWVYLKPGWRNDHAGGEHSMHCYGAKELLRDFRQTVPCDCGDCLEELGMDPVRIAMKQVLEG